MLASSFKGAYLLVWWASSLWRWSEFGLAFCMSELTRVVWTDSQRSRRVSFALPAVRRWWVRWGVVGSVYVAVLILWVRRIWWDDGSPTKWFSGKCDYECMPTLMKTFVIWWWERVKDAVMWCWGWEWLRAVWFVQDFVEGDVWRWIGMVWWFT